jgi:predicted phosphodiesterase
MLRYIEDTRPHSEVVLLGDFLSLDCISRHNEKNLRAIAEKTIQKDYAVAEQELRALKQAAGTERLIWIEGNHENRVERYIDANPQLEGSIEIPKAFQDVKWIPFWSKGTTYKHGKAMFIHGRYTNDHHAKRHVQSYAHNVFYGHTHDVQSYAQQRLGDDDTIVGHSLGCLCKYDQPYMQGTPSKWQQAFGHFYFQPNGFFNYFVVQVFKNRFIGPNGKEYTKG